MELLGAEQRNEKVESGNAPPRSLTSALADEWTLALTAGVTICDAAEPTPLSHIVTPEEPRERRHPGSMEKPARTEKWTPARGPG